MTMNCPTCKRHIYPKEARCECGYRIRGPMHPSIIENLKRIGLQQRPGETVADHAARCRQYLRDNRMLGRLPPAVRAEIDREAAEERLAIQEENDGR